jgi:hypothetical protein
MGGFIDKGHSVASLPGPLLGFSGSPTRDDHISELLHIIFGEHRVTTGFRQKKKILDAGKPSGLVDTANLTQPTRDTDPGSFSHRPRQRLRLRRKGISQGRLYGPENCGTS